MLNYIDGLLEGYTNALELIYSLENWKNNEYICLLNDFIRIKLSYFNTYKNIMSINSKSNRLDMTKYYNKGMISAYSSVLEFIKKFDLNLTDDDLRMKEKLYIYFNNSFHSLSDLSENKLNY